MEIHILHLTILQHILTNSSGCDSVIFLDLTITEINSGVYLVNDSKHELNQLILEQSINGLIAIITFSPINGETNAMFTTQNVVIML